MKPIKAPSGGNSPPASRLPWIITMGCVLVVLLICLRPRSHPNTAASTSAADSSHGSTPMTVTHSGRGLNPARTRDESPPLLARPAEEIVAEKISQFASSREEIVAAMARHYNVTVPEEVNRFFAAAAGRWEETTNLFATLNQLRMSDNRQPGLLKLWPAIVETYGVAEQAHLWPAQALLDYGNAVLDSLRPGMIYVGGNDAGRFIPALLTETSGGEPHIVLTQNALADSSYLEYVRFRYGDRLAALTPDDSQSGFQSYLADAQKRLQHDQDFPNEPKQIRPGEDVRVTDGRVQVSGQVAVMAINEQLLKTLLQKNPDLSFALTESFPLKSLYAEATTLGPITELRATDSTSVLTAERAAQSLDYWRATTQTLLAGSDANTAPRDACVSQILGQANLFQDRKLSAEAEQAYQLANQLSPANPAAVFGYVSVLTQQNRFDEARQVVQTAVNLAPDNNQFSDLLKSLNRTK